MDNKPKPTELIRRQIEAYGFNNFVDAAKRQLKLMHSETADYTILKFLLDNAVGAENAKTWKQINEHLETEGFKMTKNRFQTNLLQHSRKNLYYIGSSHNGFFLFEKQSDVNITWDFYNERVSKEVANWEALRFLSNQAVFKSNGRKRRPC